MAKRLTQEEIIKLFELYMPPCGANKPNSYAIFINGKKVTNGSGKSAWSSTGGAKNAIHNAMYQLVRELGNDRLAYDELMKHLYDSGFIRIVPMTAMEAAC